MISFETAKALKDAGLVWEPKLGDLFNTLECIEAENTSFGIWDEEMQEAYDTPGADIDVYAQRFVMASPEEAAAQALLWILRREVCSCESQ